MSELIEALQVLGNNGADVKALASELLEIDSLEDCDDVKPLVLIASGVAEPDEGIESGYDDCNFDVGNREYLVCTEDEAESRWDDALESYLDDGCVEGADSPYFDREAWKRDARMDGIGHCLSSYDGNVEEFNANGEWYSIFRIN